MLVYRPPKSSVWGHSFGKDATTAMAKLDAFIDAYFERVDKVSPTGLVVAWKESVLPKVEWPAAFQGPENLVVRRFLMSVTSNRVAFPMGIVFPLSTAEPASFEFLRSFSAAAPFKMSAKNFQVGIVSGTGKFAWRKPDAEMVAKLKEFVG